MATYEIFNGQTIEADYIYYIDPTNGDDANNGLTPETALLTPNGANGKPGGNSSILVFVDGIHYFSPTDTNYFKCTRTANNYRIYYVSNPRKTKIILDMTNANASSGHDAWLVKAYSNGSKNIFIGMDIESSGKDHGCFTPYALGNGNNNGQTTEAYNCRFRVQAGPNGQGGSSKPFFYSIASNTKFENCVFENPVAGNGLSMYVNTAVSFIAINCFFNGFLYSQMGNPSPSFTNCVSNVANPYGSNYGTVDADLSLNEEWKMLENGELITPQTIGVWQGTYSWALFLFRSNFFIRDSAGAYYRLDDDKALEAVVTPAVEEGLEVYLSPADLELIRTLDNPVLVGIETADIAYKAILLDDLQMMIPTGDIDLSLASSVNGFVLTDTGDVKRLLSVDNGTTWLYWDADAGFAEYEGDITDKAAVYAVANDTDALNALTAEQIATIIPPAAVDKHIRFLTVLKQAALADDTRTLSVGINNERRGYFKSIPAAQFEETLYTGSLQIKYIGTDAIGELHLLLAV
jgi:hypothetical protein